jgi:hypothetical protein
MTTSSQAGGRTPFLSAEKAVRKCASSTATAGIVSTVQYVLAANTSCPHLHRYPQGPELHGVMLFRG